MNNVVWASITKASAWESAVANLAAQGDGATTAVVAAWIAAGLLAAILSVIGLAAKLEWVFKVFVGLWVPITIFAWGSATSVTAMAKVRVIEVPESASRMDAASDLRALLSEDRLCRNTISLILDVSRVKDVTHLATGLRDMPRSQVGCGAAIVFFAGKSPDKGAAAALRDIAIVTRDEHLGELVKRESTRWGADHVVTVRQ